MKTIIPLARPLVLSLLVLASFMAPTLAQEVFIPDPGLNAAIREALQKPNGPLTGQDLLSLTNLGPAAGIYAAWKDWNRLITYRCFLSSPISSPTSSFRES